MVKMSEKIFEVGKNSIKFNVSQGSLFPLPLKNILKTISHEIRENIMSILYDVKEPQRFNEILKKVTSKISGSNLLSYHIRVLTDSGLVIQKFEDNNTYYSLSKAAIELINILKDFAETSTNYYQKRSENKFEDMVKYFKKPNIVSQQHNKEKNTYDNKSYRLKLDMNEKLSDSNESYQY